MDNLRFYTWCLDCILLWQHFQPFHFCWYYTEIKVVCIVTNKMFLLLLQVSIYLICHLAVCHKHSRTWHCHGSSIWLLLNKGLSEWAWFHTVAKLWVSVENARRRILYVWQHLYSEVFPMSQRQESDTTECVGDGLMSPSSAGDVLSDTSVICVYLRNCCHCPHSRSNCVCKYDSSVVDHDEGR
jgi:hypothetical protein